jgi:hypothetical protein
MKEVIESNTEAAFDEHPVGQLAVQLILYLSLQRLIKPSRSKFDQMFQFTEHKHRYWYQSLTYLHCLSAILLKRVINLRYFVHFTIKERQKTWKRPVCQTRARSCATVPLCHRYLVWKTAGADESLFPRPPRHGRKFRLIKKNYRSLAEKWRKLKHYSFSVFVRVKTICANILHHILCCELFGRQIFFEVCEFYGLKLCDRELLSEASHSLKVLQTREIYKANTTLDPNNKCLFSVYMSEFLKAVISEHGRFFIMFLKRDKSCN